MDVSNMLHALGSMMQRTWICLWL